MCYRSRSLQFRCSNQSKVFKIGCSASTAPTQNRSQGVSTNLPKQFKRLVGKRTGESFRDIAEVVTKPLVLPKDDQVLVKVKYAGINGGCETFRARGEYAFQKNKTLSEFNLGAECVGLIVACGDNVQNLKVGQDVIAVSGNGFSEYVTVKSKSCTLVSESSPEMAAMGVSGFFTGGIFKKYGQLKASDIVLVTAAGGAAGSFAVQIGKKLGCHVIGTCGSEKKVDLLKQFNVDRIINYKEENVDEVLSNEYSKGIDFVMEGVGGQLRDVAVRHLAPNGRVACTGYISQYSHNSQEQQNYTSNFGLPPADQIFWGQKDIELENGKMIYGGGLVSLDLYKQQMLDWYRKGEITAVVDKQYQFCGLESITDAVDYMLSGEALGKVVVRLY